MKKAFIFAIIIIFVACSKKTQDNQSQETNQLITPSILQENTIEITQTQNTEDILSEIYVAVEAFMGILEPDQNLIDISTNRNYPYNIREKAVVGLLSEHNLIGDMEEKLKISENNAKIVLPILQNLLEESQTFEEKNNIYIHFINAYNNLKDSSNAFIYMNKIIDSFEQNPEHKTDYLYADMLFKATEIYEKNKDYEMVLKYYYETIKYASGYQRMQGINILLETLNKLDRQSEINEFILECLNNSNSNDFLYHYAKSYYQGKIKQQETSE